MKANHIPQYILAGLIVLAYFILLYFLIFYAVPEGNQRLLDIASGALLMAFSGVVGYYFGSSKSSADKNQLLAQSKPAEDPKP